MSKSLEARERLRRPCEVCEEMFRPTGTSQKQCEKCRYSKHKKQLEIGYFKMKEELDEIRDNVTLKKWKILSKAYSYGKKIWGFNFTREKLAFDMDMPPTTVYRCLSLDKANSKSWRLVKEGRISVFKLAMICQSKNVKYQSKIVDMVIQDNLSTYQIKSLKVNNLKDINKERHRLACENGYSRKSSAYYNFSAWVRRGKLFLLMDKEYLPDEKIDDLKSDLKDLIKRINKYIK